MKRAKKKVAHRSRCPVAQVMYGKLYDDVTGKTKSVIVENNACGVLISVEGYGDLTSQEGRGTPVVVELFNNELRVIVWGDINKEEATHIIDLEGAKETRRHESK